MHRLFDRHSGRQPDIGAVTHEHRVECVEAGFSQVGIASQPGLEFLRPVNQRKGQAGQRDAVVKAVERTQLRGVVPVDEPQPVCRLADPANDRR